MTTNQGLFFGNLQEVWSTLGKDPVVRITALLLAGIISPLIIPIVSQERLPDFTEFYAEIVLLGACVLAFQYRLREIEDWEERQFWNLMTGAFAVLLVNKLFVWFLRDEAWVLTTDLTSDFFFLMAYVLILLAITARPHLKPGWTKGSVRYLIESVGRMVFASALLVYFVLIPGHLNQEAYWTYVPSLLMFVVLDVFLLFTLIQQRRMSTTGRWQKIYGVLIWAIGFWTVVDSVECLMFLEVFPYRGPGSVLDIIWFLPAPLFVVAARLRHHPFTLRQSDASRAIQVESSGTLGIFRVPFVVYAFAFPAVHFLLYQLGFLDLHSRTAREMLVLVCLLLFGTLAVAYEKLLKTDRQRALERLGLYQGRLRALVSELSLAEEEERRRVAVELDDRIGKSLALSKIKLRTFGAMLSSRDQSPLFEEINELVEQVIQDTRSLVFELSPPVVQDLEFESAIKWLTEGISHRFGISCQFECDQKPKPLTGDARVILFQFVRELLANVAKHAQASRAMVSLRRENGEVRVCVEDDGVGFDTSKIRSGPPPTRRFGLFIIRERLKLLGGRLLLESGPEKGTRATIVVPLQVASA